MRSTRWLMVVGPLALLVLGGCTGQLTSELGVPPPPGNEPGGEGGDGGTEPVTPPPPPPEVPCTAPEAPLTRLNRAELDRALAELGGGGPYTHVLPPDDVTSGFDLGSGVSSLVAS